MAQEACCDVTLPAACGVRVEVLVESVRCWSAGGWLFRCVVCTCSVYISNYTVFPAQYSTLICGSKATALINKSDVRNCVC